MLAAESTELVVWIVELWLVVDVEVLVDFDARATYPPTAIIITTITTIAIVTARDSARFIFEFLDEYMKLTSQRS